MAKLVGYTIECPHSPLQVVGTYRAEGKVQHALGNALAADMMEAQVKIARHWYKVAAKYRRALAKTEREKRRFARELESLQRAFQHSRQTLLGITLEAGIRQDTDPPGDIDDYAFSNN